MKLSSLRDRTGIDPLERQSPGISLIFLYTKMMQTKRQPLYDIIATDG
jgi:hypothetical protein